MAKKRTLDESRRQGDAAQALLTRLQGLRGQQQPFLTDRPPFGMHDEVLAQMGQMPDLGMPGQSGEPTIDAMNAAIRDWHGNANAIPNPFRREVGQLGVRAAGQPHAPPMMIPPPAPVPPPQAGVDPDRLEWAQERARQRAQFPGLHTDARPVIDNFMGFHAVSPELEALRQGPQRPVMDPRFEANVGARITGSNSMGESNVVAHKRYTDRLDARLEDIAAERQPLVFQNARDRMYKRKADLGIRPSFEIDDRMQMNDLLMDRIAQGGGNDPLMAGLLWGGPAAVGMAQANATGGRFYAALEGQRMKQRSTDIGNTAQGLMARDPSLEPREAVRQATEIVDEMMNDPNTRALNEGPAPSMIMNPAAPLAEVEKPLLPTKAQALSTFYDEGYADESLLPFTYGGEDEFVRQAVANGIGNVTKDEARQWYRKRFPGNVNIHALPPLVQPLALPFAWMNKGA